MSSGSPLDIISAREENGGGYKPFSKGLSSAKLGLFSFAR